MGRDRAMNDRLDDASRRAKAIRALREARDAEAEALAALRRIALALGASPADLSKPAEKS
jgi:hypothetical protein